MTLITEMTMRPADRSEKETMHLFDTRADEEKALCGADLPAADLTGVDAYGERRDDELPVGNICEPCKVHAVGLVEIRILNLEADSGDLRVRADQLERKASGLQPEGAERDRMRYRNCAEGRRSEADELDDEARERPSGGPHAAPRQPMGLGSWFNLQRQREGKRKGSWSYQVWWITSNSTLTFEPLFKRMVPVALAEHPVSSE